MMHECNLSISGLIDSLLRSVTWLKDARGSRLRARAKVSPCVSPPRYKTNGRSNVGLGLHSGITAPSGGPPGELQPPVVDSVKRKGMKSQRQRDRRELK